MRKKFLTLLVLAVLLLAGVGSMPFVHATTIDINSVEWSVQYMIDQSRTIFDKSQFADPRSGRGLALSPDGRYLYAGYNNPNSQSNPNRHMKQVRMIDTTIADFDDATVAILENNRGKALATDDKGRVYMAEGSDADTKDGPGIHIYDANLTTKLFTIGLGATTGLTKPEGVATTREGGMLVVYATDRTNKTLTRFEITEGPGVTITTVTRTGLGGAGTLVVAGADDLRGVEVDPSGRIWMADLGVNRVFRVNSDGTGLMSVVVTNAKDITFDDTQAFITQQVSRTIAVLQQSDMSLVATLTPPWADLELAPGGQSGNGRLAGIDVGPGPTIYVMNGLGQTPNEQSTYGRCDHESDNPGGPCTITDQTHDDNEPILRISMPFVEVDIDIKPGSDPNSINPKSKGNIPVAILSTADFDAPAEVNQTSLTFGRTGDEDSLHYKGNGAPNCNAEDVNGDGRLDLVCHFKTQQTGFQQGDTEGILKGETTGGTPIEGSDSVNIVGQ